MAAKYDYLIVGGGIAGVTAATILRESAPNSRIAIISREPVIFYSRVMLTSYIEGGVLREKLILRDEEWFRDQRIDLFLGESAEILDKKNKTVQTDKGNEFVFGKLLIATGVRPMLIDIPGAESSRVHYLWDIDEADKIIERINELNNLPSDKRKAAIIGGGFVCQSFRKIFSKKDIETHLLMRGDYYWSRYISPAAGALINEALENEGIILHPNEKVAEIIDSDNGVILKTKSGNEISAALVLVGVGIAPDVDWLRESGVELDNGIKVNEYMETSLPDVYAAGDAVNYYDPNLGDFHRQGNWVNGERQGRIAAINMLGNREAYQAVTSFAIPFLGISFIFVGEYSKKFADEAVVRADQADKKIREFYFRGDRLIGAMLMNAAEDRPLIETAIKDKIELSKKEKINLKDADFPLEKTKIWSLTKKQ